MADRKQETRSTPVKMTRRIVVEVYATAEESDAVREAFEQVGAHVNATARYHHMHSAPCCIQAPASAFSSARPPSAAASGATDA